LYSILLHYAQETTGSAIDEQVAGVVGLDHVAK
jgi:hypothetical protein